VKIKIVKCPCSSYWYSKCIGKIYDVKVSTKFPGDYAIIGDPSRLIDIKDCRPLKAKVVAKPAHNTASLKCPHCGKNVIIAVTSGIA
jgi:hypothetical protein